jgi:hypothetical protein
MSFHKTYNPLSPKQDLCRQASDIVSSDDRGRIFSSPYVISDTQSSDLTHVLRTADFIQTIQDDKMDKVPTALQHNVAIFDSAGQVIDSGSSIKKCYVRAKFDAIPIPLGILTLTATAVLDDELTWDGTYFTAPRKGRYLVNAVLRMFDAQIGADRWYELQIKSPFGSCRNRIVFSAANAGVGDDDSLWVSVSDSVQLESGEQIFFVITNATSFDKVADSDLSLLTVSEL